MNHNKTKSVNVEIILDLRHDFVCNRMLVRKNCLDDLFLQITYLHNINMFIVDKFVFV